MVQGDANQELHTPRSDEPKGEEPSRVEHGEKPPKVQAADKGRQCNGGPGAGAEHENSEVDGGAVHVRGSGNWRTR